jgi:hypothetical protein
VPVWTGWFKMKMLDGHICQRSSQCGGFEIYTTKR